MYSNYLLKDWFKFRSIESIVHSYTSVIPLQAASYDVMLVKMLRTVPESQRAKIVIQPVRSGRSILHCAASEGYHESTLTILSFVPESERLRIVSERCPTDRSSVLHLAAASGNLELVKSILTLYPESERFCAVTSRDMRQRTVLFMAVISENLELIEFILMLFPEFQRLQVMDMHNSEGETALHFVARRGNIEALKLGDGRTILHHVAFSAKSDCIKSILSALPESQRLQATSLRSE